MLDFFFKFPVVAIIKPFCTQMETILHLDLDDWSGHAHHEISLIYE